MKAICPRCGQSITAMADWVGEFVNCPKCGKKVLIAGAKEPDANDGSGKANDPKKASPKPGSTQEKRPAAAKPKDPFDFDDDEDDFRLTPTEQRPKATVVEDDFRLSPEVSRPKPETLLESSLPPPSKPPPARPKTSPKANAPTGSTSKPAPRSAPPAAPKHKTADDPCPNCGAKLPPDGMLCVECGYHLVLKRVLQTDMRDMGLDGASGFQRWLNKQIAEGESVTGLIWILHAVLLVIAIALGLLFRPIGWYIVGPAYAVYFLFVLWVQKSKVYLRWGDAIWNLMLRRNQRRGWREASPPFRKRNAFISHDRAFDDQALGELPGLEELEVLDLQGTGITDAALRHVQYCAALKYIVIRGTKMTAQGAKRLQVMKPDVYIWF